MDSSPPGSSVLQARTLQWVAISLANIDSPLVYPLSSSQVLHLAPILPPCGFRPPPMAPDCRSPRGWFSGAPSRGHKAWRQPNYQTGILQPRSGTLSSGAKTHEKKKPTSFYVEEFSLGIQPPEDSVGIDITLEKCTCIHRAGPDCCWREPALSDSRDVGKRKVLQGCPGQQFSTRGDGVPTWPI